MDSGRIIIQEERFALTIDRLCYELIERCSKFEDICLVGVQPRGSLLSDRVYQRLCHLAPDLVLQYGKLDITFYRDDFRTRQKPLRASVTDMNFLVEGKHVILIDDVLYTGRTIQAALTALNHYGRPREVELMVLVDRRFNRVLPIHADYVGITVDAVDHAYVRVIWHEKEGLDQVVLYPSKEAAQGS